MGAARIGGGGAVEALRAKSWRRKVVLGRPLKGGPLLDPSSGSLKTDLIESDYIPLILSPIEAQGVHAGHWRSHG